MSDIRIRRALISVYDKTGIVDFARALHGEFGIEIISTGGTAALLRENDIPVTLVEDITGFPEMLDGRVKTLHPKIHAAILADRDNPEHMRQLAEQNIQPIDMVVVNLYPFEETVRKPDCTFDEAIEMIDIGGPCLLRAAAKNHNGPLVVPSEKHYAYILKELRATNGLAQSETRKRYAHGAFITTSWFDKHVSNWLGWNIQQKIQDRPDTVFPKVYRVLEQLIGKLRYGENPHQEAAVYQDQLSRGAPSIAHVSRIVGPEMSFNNYVDADSSAQLCRELGCHIESGSQCVSVLTKHTNACGVGVAIDPVEAYRRAYLGDPRATIGGVLAVNHNVNAEFALAVMESLDRWGGAAGASAFFIEVWCAHSFDEGAIEVVRNSKKWGERVRIVPLNDGASPAEENAMDFRKIHGGMLVQTGDIVGLKEEEWKTASERAPTDSEMSDLRLAWLVCKHTKSNAISICREGMLIGNGAGQASRVMSCRIATWLANENGHSEKLKGAVAASDAFFPFRDGPDLLIDAGVSAIIQPGGSKRDEETLAACNERDVAMIFTGTRHFKH